ncbi:MAG: LysR family transcriptional regulator [Gammaproteobacteria bacterium]|nr:LysR family transcriptional regulator [Gammaproteobacteria bacterium]MCW8988480.1 LysR family transcriptional regulator [Gammaproteobacteria bacterium]MCW9031785.1 LysR family transcriptional regulator [Gammaproteobacteria bacterium]
MKTHARVTLEQWRVFQAIIEQGGYAQAAAYLHRSQSAISYAMSRLQDQLGISLLKIEGRKALLTEQGQILLNRSRQLTDEAIEIENFAQHLSQGREAEIKLVVDAAFPNELLMRALAEFASQSKGTRVQLREVILSGASDALLSEKAELVIGVQTPSGFLSDPLIEVELIGVAHHNHPLHQLGREITSADLAQHMHVVIQDSGENEKMDVGWLSSQDRWTVSSIESALSAIEHGLGYAWLPHNRVQEAINEERLKPLLLEQGSTYKAFLFISFGHPQNIGPATRELANIIKKTVANVV